MELEKLRALIRRSVDLASGLDPRDYEIRGSLRQALEILKAEEPRRRDAVGDHPPSRTVEVDFWIGQTVCFRLDPSSVGLVTSIHVRDGSVTYGVTWDNRSDTVHHAFEIAASDRPTVFYQG